MKNLGTEVVDDTIPILEAGKYQRYSGIFSRSPSLTRNIIFIYAMQPSLWDISKMQKHLFKLKLPHKNAENFNFVCFRMRLAPV